LQRKSKYLAIRQLFYPIASFGSQFALISIILGFLFSSFWIFCGIFALMIILIIQLLILKVEQDASKIALAELQKNHLIVEQEAEGVKDVLNNMALSYLAISTIALTRLIRLIFGVK